MGSLKDHNDVSIVDIRRGGSDFSILDEMRENLKPSNGQEKRLPTLLLYDEEGLKLFEDITYLEEYYPTNSEIEVLNKHADDIARFINDGALLVELGSGYDARQCQRSPREPTDYPSSRCSRYANTDHTTVISGR